MTTKKTLAQLELETLLAGLERGAPTAELAPLVESLQERLVPHATELDATALERGIARHISSTHEEALLDIWLEVSLKLTYRLETMRSNLYTAAEGVRDPITHDELDLRTQELPPNESAFLYPRLEGSPATKLVELSRAGLERWGSPSFLAYESFGLLGLGRTKDALKRIDPLTRLEDRSGLRSSGLSAAAAAAEMLGDEPAAARWTLMCHEEDAAAPILLPVAFIHALKAGDQQLCAEADAHLYSRYALGGGDSPFLGAALRRTQAQLLGTKLGLPREALALARRENRFRSTIAKKICHALAQPDLE
jgi:hypothetical protein